MIVLLYVVKQCKISELPLRIRYKSGTDTYFNTRDSYIYKRSIIPILAHIFKSRALAPYLSPEQITTYSLFMRSD